MQENYYPIGIRPWNIKELKYKEKSGEIIEFEIAGTYSCEYNSSKYNPISNYISQIDDSFTSVIKNIINEKLVEYQNSNRSFNDFAEYLKSNQIIYEFYTKLNGIVESKGFKSPTAKCLEVKTSLQSEPALARKLNEEPIIINTNSDKKDGQNKCPKCGATDITLNINNGKLRCDFCRHEFEPENLDELYTDINKLEGQVIGSGATDIVADASDIVTFKCSSCGAEVVVDTASSTQARCHWCRNTLSVNQQIPNGSIPDAVLPFKLSKDEARLQIESFVRKRKFFAHPKFKQEFTTENIMGVYFPYMVVDVNSHMYLKGNGEHEVRHYVRKNGNSSTTYYDADLYQIERDFDFTINGLTIESNLERLNTNSNQTNNIINAIMPFDIENCIKYNAGYLKGYTSEKRNTNVEQLHSIVQAQSKDIARIKANDTLTQYDRGVDWDIETLDIKGEQWKAAYLPVWLYSYQDPNKKILHYVAVNARTKETIGSVPIHTPKLILTSFIVEIIGILMMLFLDLESDWLFLLIGFVFFILMYLRYRNKNARHEYEHDTKSQISNLKQSDVFIKRETGLTNSIMRGANNKNVSAINAGNSVYQKFKQK